ncbi:MAG TPA: hypothetical protein VFR37_11920 [Longimicrobium sp.]|nr:hypothetical protein [Longimicrobium sp.]
MTTRHRFARIAAAGLLLLAAGCSADGPRLPTDTEDPRRPPDGGQTYVAPTGVQAQYA